MPDIAATTADTKIRVENLSKGFDVQGNQVIALDDITLLIPEGEFWCLVGPSGCGKTTLLRILGGLERQSTGRFLIEVSDPNRPATAMVFQDRSALPWMSVRDNIGFGLDMRRVPHDERDPVVDYYLEAVGLRAFADALPHQLSGGMQQRVALARAFATKPEVLLMDEPFGALDQQNRTLLQNELLRVWEEERRRTVVFITHDVGEAIALGDVIVVMSAQPGKILSAIRVPFERPRDVIDVRASPEFGGLQRQIWDVLRDEVLRARASEEPR